MGRDGAASRAGFLHLSVEEGIPKEVKGSATVSAGLDQAVSHWPSVK